MRPGSMSASQHEVLRSGRFVAFGSCLRRIDQGREFNDLHREGDFRVTITAQNTFTVPTPHSVRWSGFHPMQLQAGRAWRLGSMLPTR
jgi:hypothetical protein